MKERAKAPTKVGGVTAFPGDKVGAINQSHYPYRNLEMVYQAKIKNPRSTPDEDGAPCSLCVS